MLTLAQRRRKTGFCNIANFSGALESAKGYRLYLVKLVQEMPAYVDPGAARFPELICPTPKDAV
jgi:hypothetical protein